jgi:pyridoxamine 5'-phosphate oxidase
MSEWFTNLDGLWLQMWKTLDDGVARRDAAARHPTLATLGHDGWPEARTVVLRSADRDTGTLSVHTDLHSAKVKSLQSCPRAALHVWNSDDRLQLRLSAEVSVRSGADVAGVWAAVTDHARQSYGVTPAPGLPISAALDYVKSPGIGSFAVLECRIVAVDLLHLGERHRRAGYRREGGWSGQWLAP